MYNHDSLTIIIHHLTILSPQLEAHLEAHLGPFNSLVFADPQVEADPFANRLRVTRRAGDDDLGGVRRDSESAPLGAGAYNDQLRTATRGAPGEAPG